MERDNVVHWNDRDDGLNLNHVTHWRFRPAKNPDDPESKDQLFVYLDAPEMVTGLGSQAIAVYEGDVARRLRNYLAASGVELP